MSLVLVVALTFFVAGVVKAHRMRLPTVAMGVLCAIVSPLTAAGLLIVPAFVTNIWRLVAGPSFAPLLGRLWPMMATIVFGTFGGASLLTLGDANLTKPPLARARRLRRPFRSLSGRSACPLR
jgi:hypothetical protein